MWKLEFYFASIIFFSVRSTPLWEKGRIRIRIHTSGPTLVQSAYNNSNRKSDSAQYLDAKLIWRKTHFLPYRDPVKYRQAGRGTGYRNYSIKKFLYKNILKMGPVLRIPDVYPGPRIRLFPFRIQNPYCFHPGSRIRIEEFKYFNPQKRFLISRKYDLGCSSRIRILTFYRFRIQGSKRHRIPDPQHWMGP